MRGMLGLTRRGFVKWMVAFGTLSPGIVQAAARPRAESTARRLLAAWSHPDSAKEIGRVYLVGHPAEADATLLCHYLESTCVQPERGRPDWSAVIRDDFARGNTVVVDGWVLSRTEARLCALAVMV